MNDEAESSRAPQRHDDSSPEHVDPDDATAALDDEEEERYKVKNAKGRRLDAKRKRMRMLNELLRDLDMVVYLELITVYYLEYDCHHASGNTANNTFTAARSSGSLSKPSHTECCLRPLPTQQPSIARQTNRSRSLCC